VIKTLITGNQCSLAMGVQNEQLGYTRLFVCGRRNRRFNIITGMWNNRTWELRSVKHINEEWPKERWIIRQFAIIVNLVSWFIIYLTPREGARRDTHKHFLYPGSWYFFGSKFSDLLFLGCTNFFFFLGYSKYWYFYGVTLIKMHILTYFLLFCVNFMFFCVCLFFFLSFSKQIVWIQKLMRYLY
jgi:hypothetical protein